MANGKRGLLAKLRDQLPGIVTGTGLGASCVLLLLPGGQFASYRESPPRIVIAAVSHEKKTYSDSNVADAIERAEKTFRQTPVVYNKPATLPFNKPSRFVLSVASSQFPTAIERVSTGKGDLVTVEVKLGDKVRAELEGPDGLVDVKLVGPDTKTISRSANATWVWYVTPKTLDDIDLTLTLYNKVKVGDELEEVEGPAYVDTFPVASTAWDRFAVWMAKIDPVAATVIALGTAFAGLLAFLGLRKKPPSDA